MKRRPRVPRTAVDLPSPGFPCGKIFLGLGVEHSCFVCLLG